MEDSTVGDWVVSVGRLPRRGPGAIIGDAEREELREEVGEDSDRKPEVKKGEYGEPV